MDIKRTTRDAGARVGLVGEMLGYLAKRRLWFIIPMVAVLLLFGLLIVLAQATAIGPLIYTLF
ncbi:DUF5989 family protein [Candidatus Amarolinea aalborgensis]|jgi:hypothetical protein|uniref:DUF5989 family protein n=1 Tax=Candidatus Amarolinea aalborgensis TaxID=2249329 RepID=UPI003BF95B1D